MPTILIILIVIYLFDIVFLILTKPENRRGTGWYALIPGTGIYSFFNSILK